MKKIIVAGGGHGGIAVAAKLAQKGYDVTVYERNEEGKMGYDWTDIFNHKSLAAAGLPMPEKDKYSVKGDVTFYGPSENTRLVQLSPKNQPEIKMERRDIYDLLIKNAEKSGVKFEYGCTVLEPVCNGKRVVGIKTGKGEFSADLIIDACGCDSPLRMKLPDSLGIQKNMKPFEKFYIYRAFYDNPTGIKSDEEFKLTLLPEGISGIGWVMSEKEYSDVLVGRFVPFGLEEAKKSVAYYRTKNNNIGTKILRGGSFAYIPVRQPLGKMVADGYAAIGDSAFMAIPLIGSGIANALYASDMLANAIINDSAQKFTVETLWKYEYEYFKEIAISCAPLACLKNILAKTKSDSLDEVFDKGFKEAQSLIPFKSEKALKNANAFIEITLRLKNILACKAISSELKKSIKDMIKLFAVLKKMPEEYSEDAVLVWVQSYNRIFNG